MQAAAFSKEPVSSGVAPDVFRKAMRNFAGTVAVVTSGQGASRRGLTITTVCSLSTDPPSVAICINQRAEAHDVIKSAGVFGVSILSAGHVALARTFSGQDGTKGLDRFLAGRWIELETKAPLLEDAVTNLDCRIINVIDAGTHTLFCGLVVATQATSASRPLIHYDGEFASLT
jgi:flavin reductase (DIM6/NTAB) family NADH-FMN oxidoreductase RutF